MDKVWVFQHAPGEGLGVLAEMLGRYRVTRQMFHVHAGDPVPETLDGAAGLVILGGPMSVNGGLPFIAAEQALVRAALDADLPVLGICLGAQVIASALSATVEPAAFPEVGWLPVRWTEDEVSNRWASGLPEEFEAFHWHEETFALPEGAQRLAGSAVCPNQAFVIGSALALQFHPEMTETMVREWAAGMPAELRRAAGRTVQTPEQMLERLPARLTVLGGVAEHVLGIWIAGVQARG